MANSKATVVSTRRFAPLVLITGLLSTPLNGSEWPSPHCGWQGQEQRDAKAPDTYRRRWAVVVGIDSYAGDASLPPLDYAVNDAREFRDILVGEFGYAATDCEYLHGSVQYQHITTALAKIAQNPDLREDDAVIFYFSGHGVMDADSPWIAGCNSTIQNKATHVDMEVIKSSLASVPGRHKLIVLDCCYSGGLFRDRDSLRTNTSPRPGERVNGARGFGHLEIGDSLSYYLAQPAFVGISAGRETPVSDGDGNDRHSVFTAALLATLRDRADTPRSDHAFTFRQLAASVEARVATSRGRMQIPDWGRLNDGRGDFVFQPTIRRKTPRDASAEAAFLSEAAAALERRDRASAALLTAEAVGIVTCTANRQRLGTIMAHAPLLVVVQMPSDPPGEPCFNADRPTEWAIVTKQAVKVHDCESGACVRELPFPAGAETAYFSKDGTAVIFGRRSEDSLTIVDVTSGAATGKLPKDVDQRKGGLSADAHIGVVVRHELSEGKYVDIARVFDARKGTEILCSPKDLGPIHWAVVNDSGTHVAFTAFSGRTKVYQIGPQCIELGALGSETGRRDRPWVSSDGRTLLERQEFSEEFVALDTKTGRRKWATKIENCFAGPIEGGVMCGFSGIGAQLFNLEDGARRGTFEMSGLWMKYATAEGVCVFGTHNDGAEGRVFWVRPEGGGAEEFGRGEWSSWAANRDCSYVVTTRSFLMPIAGPRPPNLICVWKSPRLRSVASSSFPLPKHSVVDRFSRTALVRIPADEKDPYSIRRWDWETGKTAAACGKLKSTSRLVCVSNSGELMALCEAEGRSFALRVFATGTAKEACKPISLSYEVESGFFCNEDRTLCFGTGEGTVRYWSLANNAPDGPDWIYDGVSKNGDRRGIRTSKAHVRVGVSTDRSIAFANSSYGDGTRRSGAVVLWDVASRAEAGELVGAEFSWLLGLFSPDRSRLITANDWGAYLWDVTKRTRFADGVWDPSGDVSSFEFSPSGQFFLRNATKSAVVLCRSEDGKQVSRAMECDGRVRSSRFSPSGMMIVTACEGGSVRLWDSETGAWISTKLQHGNSLVDAFFDGDGEVVSIDSSGRAMMWPVCEYAASSAFAGEYVKLCYERSIESADRRVIVDRCVWNGWQALARDNPECFTAHGRLLIDQVFK